MTVYLNIRSAGADNFLAIAQKGAYTTENEETSKNAVIADRFGLKTGLTIAAIVSIIALSIILGVTVGAAAAAVITAIIIPIGLWFFFRARHQKLESVHEEEYQKCMDILSRVGDSLTTVREGKIAYIMKNHQLRGPVITEENYEQDNNYGNMVDLAKKAKKLITEHYTVDYASTSDVNHFVRACTHITGEQYGDKADDRNYITNGEGSYVIKPLPYNPNAGTSVVDPEIVIK